MGQWISPVLICFLSGVCVRCQTNYTSQLDVRRVEKSSPVIFIPATAPTNLQVIASPYDQSRQLQLNISWDSSSDGPQATSFNLHALSLNELDDRCNTEPYYEYIENPNTRMWVIYPKTMSEVDNHVSSFIVLPGCSYRVKLEANPHDGRTYIQTDYKVPDCVEQICRCQQTESLPLPKLEVKSNKNIVNITWFTDEAYNISKFILRAGPLLHHSGNIGVYNLSWRVEVLSVEGLTLYHLQYKAAGPGRYAATLQVVDSHQCLGTEQQTVFLVNDYKQIDGEASTKTKLLWIILLPFGTIILVVYILIGLTWKSYLVWIEYKKTACNLKLRVSYKAFRVNSDRVFRRNDSLQERNILYVEKEIEDAKTRGEVDGYEISYNQLTILREIGRGAFGHVYLAKGEAIRGVPGTRMVAVKKLKEKANREEREEFLEEIGMLKKVGNHPNIVSLLGCCTLKADVCMVMEYVPCGDLLNYLRSLRRSLARRTSSVTSSDTMYSSPSTVMTSVNSSMHSTNQFTQDCPSIEHPTPIDHRELQHFALQIAHGMAHLESKRITHRDLAARNILIDKNKILKISDFGLSRRGVYINTRQCKVPLRWLSVEAMRDALYSSKSDVWAFAIVLWEIGTLGGFPYPTVNDFDLLNFLERGNRLEKPDIVSSNLYSVMQVCWSERPDDRPSFTELVSYLSPSSDRHVYVQISPHPQLPPTTPDLYVNSTVSPS
ncbi:angiopoietin-1 receptor-like [Macrosteles quadrilineatus]|uniref:angiopoietin-1 receptor-like n=1 Tax=Macrosteles quadrilineatus TaxID=74068 RepID=UPI0023E2A3E9|nr:angiopoietin-1 receptor-like [Macrosteles quadrilineatus]XP_054264256.1 angiopoietin-1 receptor-like [Macrosteles quadrilineatus]